MKEYKSRLQEIRCTVKSDTLSTVTIGIDRALSAQLALFCGRHTTALGSAHVPPRGAQLNFAQRNTKWPAATAHPLDARQLVERENCLDL